MPERHPCAQSVCRPLSAHAPDADSSPRAQSSTPRKDDAEPPAARRGFAAMDPQQQRQLASQGGRAAQERGTAHHFTSAEAREAGRKGGTAVSRDRDHMSRIGRKGGQRRHQKRAEAAGP